MKDCNSPSQMFVLPDMVPEIMVENDWKHSAIPSGRNVKPGLLLSPSLSRRLRESSVQVMQSRVDRSLVFS